MCTVREYKEMMDTRKRYKNGDPGRKYNKMAESMGGNKQKE